MFSEYWEENERSALMELTCGLRAQRWGFTKSIICCDIPAAKCQACMEAIRNIGISVMFAITALRGLLFFKPIGARLPAGDYATPGLNK